MKIREKIRELMPSLYWTLKRKLDWIAYTVPNFFRNVYRFRNILANTYDWDATACLRMMKIHLERVANYLETNGQEVKEHRLKKVEKIRRAVALLELHSEEDFISWAEERTGEKVIETDYYFEKSEEHKGCYQMKDHLTDEEKAHNGRIYKAAQEIATETWKELFDILRGQDPEVYHILLELSKSSDPKQSSDLWFNWFDGSGLKHWWD